MHAGEDAVKKYVLLLYLSPTLNLNFVGSLFSFSFLSIQLDSDIMALSDSGTVSLSLLDEYCNDRARFFMICATVSLSLIYIVSSNIKFKFTCIILPVYVYCIV